MEKFYFESHNTQRYVRPSPEFSQSSNRQMFYKISQLTSKIKKNMIMMMMLKIHLKVMDIIPRTNLSPKEQKTNK